ncbi:MAG: alanine--tRNA ligase [Candidatus Saccharibacteria bacterium]|nr:alanine--tRNA ligase [Candidatus Saccharibacteria bacterium]
MNAQDIRNKYLSHFKNQGHVIIPRANMVPYNEPSVLFTGSGMQPLIPYLLGEKHPEGTRLVDSQTCLRAQDIEEIGDNRHTTFFEMLGNWSLGDYYKKEEINWLFDFLVNVVGLDPKRLFITCYIGNEEFGIPKDTEAAGLWIDLFKTQGIEAKTVDIGSEADGYAKGMGDGKIFYYEGKKNWWSRNGAEKDTPIGDPCGPDTEVFYLFDQVEHDTKWGEHCHPNCDCGRFIEIANSVFMAYKRTEAGFEPLAKPNVDFGGGLERIASAAIDSPDVFKISLLWPIIEKLEQLSHKTYDSHTESMRVIADHLRAATFLAVDGVAPSNKEQGYVMRRLMRRAILRAFDLGIEQNFMQEVVPVIADLYHNDYPEVAENRQKVVDVLMKEEKVFRQTLRKGKAMVGKLSADGLTGKEVFVLYDTYGFPVELSIEEATVQGVKISDSWREEFETLMAEQKARSQTASKGAFKGGLGGHTLQHKKYHTATHLMYQALRDVLGDHVVQNGSNITEERLRFDFSHPEKVTAEQLKQVEDIVNREIEKDLQVSYAEYPTKVAREEKGALGQFGDRYGETVKVYSMKDPKSSADERPFSFEICGGPHVDHTLQLLEDGKRFKILKEEASSAGIRRIKAVLQ